MTIIVCYVHNTYIDFVVISLSDRISYNIYPVQVAAERPIVLDDIDISEDEPKEEVVKETKEEGKEHPKVEEDDDIMEVTDIEFIKPVFPVEDLTVSDSESVADKDEEKTEMLEDVSKEDVIVNNEDSPVTEPPNIESSNELPLENTNEEQKGMVIIVVFDHCKSPLLYYNSNQIIVMFILLNVILFN